MFTSERYNNRQNTMIKETKLVKDSITNENTMDKGDMKNEHLLEKDTITKGGMQLEKDTITKGDEPSERSNNTQNTMDK